MNVKGRLPGFTQVSSADWRCLPVLTAARIFGDWMPVRARRTTSWGVGLPVPAPPPTSTGREESTPQPQVSSGIWPANPLAVADPGIVARLRKNVGPGCAGMVGSAAATDAGPVDSGSDAVVMRASSCRTAQMPAAFSSAATSSSRWVSSRCRCGTVRRQPVRPKHHAAVVRRAGDVESHTVDRDRDGVGADQLRAVPVVRRPGTGDVADDQVVRRPDDALHPQHRGEDRRRLSRGTHREDLHRGHRRQRLLAVPHGAVNRRSRSAGSSLSVAELHHHRADGVAALAGGDVRLLGVEADRDHRDERCVGESVQLDQVGAHGTAAHGHHDVVQRGAGGLADRRAAARSASPGPRTGASR